MDEHDDDLDSTVHEDADQETDSYPNTSDELDQAAADERDGDADDDELDLDDDASEL